MNRFLLKIKMGYPTVEEGIHILKRFRRQNPLEELHSVINAETVMNAQ